MEDIEIAEPTGTVGTAHPHLRGEHMTAVVPPYQGPRLLLKAKKRVFKLHIHGYYPNRPLFTYIDVSEWNLTGHSASKRSCELSLMSSLALEHCSHIGRSDAHPH